MPTDPLPFRDPGLPIRKRVDDLLTRLSLDERIAMLHQFAPGVERLALAAFRTGQEALHGVAWMGPATVFPQAVGLGATWNPKLLQQVGEAVGREIRAMRARDRRVGLNVWSPTVNLLRHPLWGRNEEGYAEDPLLTAELATAYTRGLRGDHPRYWRTAPVLKHWLAHNHETDRDTASSSVRPRVLHEYELPTFRGPVAAGTAAGVMPAYNLVNGRPNHLSPLLREELRTWTERELVVCSDAWAPSNLVDTEHYFDTHEEATAAALRAGVDNFTDHDQDSSVTVGRVRGALERGLIGEEDIDTAVRRLLTMRCALGEFDPDGGPYGDTGDHAWDTPAHRRLARKAAEEAVVLLKNDGLLPLPTQAGRVAVVGLLADASKLDWYSGTLIRRCTPLDGLRSRLGPDAVSYAEGADRVRLSCTDGWVTGPQAGPGDPEGEAAVPCAAPPVVGGTPDPATDTDQAHHTHHAHHTGPPPLTVGAQPAEFALVDWGGGVLTLRAPNGRWLSVAEDGLLRASAAQPGGWVVRETFRRVACATGDGERLLHLATGRYIRATGGVLALAEAGEPGDAFRFHTLERGADAVARVAAGADAVIVVAGNDPHIRGRETEDRSTLALPAQQEELWRAAHAANPRTVLVLTSSYPYAVGAAHARLPALLWTAHGGQAAGTALARVLCGDVSPAGRLPQTWYTDDADLPDLLDYDIIGSRATYLYFDGTPLYPFGHGLSYASFAYRDLSVSLTGRGTADGAGRERHGDAPDRPEALQVSLTVANTSPIPADEVVQLYARALDPPLPRPHRALVGHRRIHLAPGACRRLDFTLSPTETLGYWDVAHGGWTLAPGRYEIQAGASSRDIRTTAALTVEGTAPAPRPLLTSGLEAADFDAQRGTRLVDRTRERGDAVAVSGTAEGRLVFCGCDFGPEADAADPTAARAGTVTALVARAAPEDAALAGSGPEDPGFDGPAREDAAVELQLADGTPLASLRVPGTGGRYRYTTVTATVPHWPSGVHDLHVTLRGALRLARLGFSGTGARETD